MSSGSNDSTNDRVWAMAARMSASSSAGGSLRPASGEWDVPLAARAWVFADGLLYVAGEVLRVSEVQMSARIVSSRSSGCDRARTLSVFPCLAWIQCAHALPGCERQVWTPRSKSWPRARGSSSTRSSGDLGSAI